MNAITSDIHASPKPGQTIAQLAVIRDSDDRLCSLLANQVRALGLAEVAICAATSGGMAAEDALRHAPCTGVLVMGLRDPITGPVHLAEARRRLPGWVIIAIDHLGTSDSAADALANGADDVLTMSFPPSSRSLREFEARLALRMRQSGMAERSTVLRAPLLARAQLTPVEAEIMHILLAHQGQIVTRNLLSQKLDRADWHYGDRKFDVHITRIRKKLKEAFGDRFLVSTIRSQGYLVQVPDEARMT